MGEGVGPCKPTHIQSNEWESMGRAANAVSGQWCPKRNACVVPSHAWIHLSGLVWAIEFYSPFVGFYGSALWRSGSTWRGQVWEGAATASTWKLKLEGREAAALESRLRCGWCGLVGWLNKAYCEAIKGLRE